MTTALELSLRGYLHQPVTNRSTPIGRALQFVYRQYLWYCSDYSAYLQAESRVVQALLAGQNSVASMVDLIRVVKEKGPQDVRIELVAGIIRGHLTTAVQHIRFQEAFCRALIQEQKIATLAEAHQFRQDIARYASQLSARRELDGLTVQSSAIQLGGIAGLKMEKEQAAPDLRPFADEMIALCERGVSNAETLRRQRLTKLINRLYADLTSGKAIDRNRLAQLLKQEDELKKRA